MSSLPPSSPPAPFSDTDDSLDERDAVPDADEEPEEEEDGEDLFGENLHEYVLSIFRPRLHAFPPSTHPESNPMLPFWFFSRVFELLLNTFASTVTMPLMRLSTDTRTRTSTMRKNLAKCQLHKGGRRKLRWPDEIVWNGAGVAVHGPRDGRVTQDSWNQTTWKTRTWTMVAFYLR